MSNETPAKTLLVAVILCLACSVVVSTTAVGLKPIQNLNKELDKKKNILLAAGLYSEGDNIDSLFENVRPVAIDLSTGQIADQIDPGSYDQKKAAKDPNSNYQIPGAEDLGKIKARAKVALIYVVQESGTVSQVIFPIHGKGLWSTLYGFLSLKSDLKTVKGITFYQHGETPGLGGEVDNPKWKSFWKDKVAFDDNSKPVITVVKGSVDHSDPSNKHKIDGMSGATITSNGVTNLVRYWLGDNAFGPFIKNYRNNLGGLLE